MKRILFAILAIGSLSLSSCIKEQIKHYTGPTVIEFDAAGKNSATSPFTYRVLTRVPLYGRPETSVAVGTQPADPLITRSMANPVVRLQVNLVGAQMSTPQIFTYSILTNVTPPGTGQLGVTGLHFTTTGTFTIPANSSFGEVIINVLNTGTTSNIPREVHLELAPNGVIGVSENYKKIAIRISQT